MRQIGMKCVYRVNEIVGKDPTIICTGCGQSAVRAGLVYDRSDIKDILNIDDVISGRADQRDGKVCMELVIDKKAALPLCAVCTDIMLR